MQNNALEAFKSAMRMELEGKAFYEKTRSQVKTEKEKVLAL